jgi:hypothetical protein
MADDFTVKLEGWSQLQRSFKAVDRRLPLELKRELRVIADEVRVAAVDIAGQRGLAPPGRSGRGTGALIGGIKTFSTQSAAGVRDTTVRGGFNYPAVYEYGHGRVRAFLNPALEQKHEIVVTKISEMFDRLASSEGLGRGGIL